MNTAKLIFRKVLFFMAFLFGNKSFSQTNANTWTWIKGSNGIGGDRVFGSIGVPAVDNSPGGRHNQGSWGALSSKMYIFGGQAYGSSNTNNNGLLNDLWQFDPSTNNWAWISGSQISNQSGIYGTKGMPNISNIPGAREIFSTWTYNNILYLMGGYGIDANGNTDLLNDLWKFDLNTKLWTWLRGSNIGEQVGVYGNQGAGSVLNEPGARSTSCTWTTNFNYLFGGYGKGHDSGKGFLNDLWKYDPITNNWTWIKGSNNPGQSGVYGVKGVESPNNTPGGRDRAVSWEYNGKLYLFGGYGYDANGKSGLLNDLWKFDPVTNNWTWLKGSNLVQSIGSLGVKGVEITSNNPSARLSALSWIFNEKFYLFSGESGDFGQSTDELWQYDPQTNNWTWIKGSSQLNEQPVYGSQGVPSQANTPGYRRNSSSAYLYNFKLYLMGGFTGEIQSGFDLKNDVWEYKPCTQMTTVMAGNWNDPNVWSCGKVPNLNDAVFIGHNVILNSAISCKNITYTIGGGITFSAGGNIMFAIP
jgi:N-acetylneuraminic acid mutarotase